MRSFYEAIRPLIPFTSLFALTTVWAIWSRNDICALEPRLLFVLYGTVFSNICVCIYYYRLKNFKSIFFLLIFIQCRLIIAQMSDTRTDCWNFFIWPMLAIVLVSIFPYSQFGFAEIRPITEQWMVYVSVAVATFAHIHFGYGVVS